MFRASVIFGFWLLASTNAHADKVSRLQDELDDAQNEARQLGQQVTKCKSEASRKDVDARLADSRLKDFMVRFPVREQWTKANQSEYDRLAEESATKRAAHQAALAGCDDLAGQQAEAKANAKKAQAKIDRAEEQAEKGKKTENCVECNKEKPKYQGKSGWESFADIVKAATPLGLGAMNTYAGIKAMDKQSSDYQLYANTMSANGLPFSQNTSGYSGIMSSMSSTNSMLSMLSLMGGGSSMMGSGGFGTMNMGMGGYGYGNGMMGMSSMGMSGYGYGNGMMGMSSMGMSGYGYGYGIGSGYGYGNGIGYGGYSYPSYGSYGYPSYSSYASSPYSYYGLSGYGGYSTGYGSYYGANSAYYTSLRSTQQSAVSSQDAMIAQQAVYAAQARYQQVLGGSSGYGYGYGYTGTSYPYGTSVGSLTSVRY